MSDTYTSFEFRPAPVAQEVPEWMWGRSLSAKISVADLAEIFGPVGDQNPSDIAARYRSALETAAQNKVANFKRRPAEPVILTKRDFKI